MLNDCVRKQGLEKVETKALVHTSNKCQRYARSVCRDWHHSFNWTVLGISFVKANEENSIVDARICWGDLNI